MDFCEKEEIIWNPRNSLHKNKNAVNDDWIKIKDQICIGCTIQELEKKLTYGNILTIIIIIRLEFTITTEYIVIIKRLSLIHNC